MAEALPDPFAELISEMLARRFDVQTDEGPSRRGSRLVELTRPEGPRVRVVCDLMGLWNVEVEVAGEFYGIYEIAAALDDGAPRNRAPALNHAEGRRALLDAVDRVPVAGTDPAPIRQRLVAQRERQSTDLRD